MGLRGGAPSGEPAVSFPWTRRGDAALGSAQRRIRPLQMYERLTMNHSSVSMISARTDKKYIIDASY